MIETIACIAGFCGMAMFFIPSVKVTLDSLFSTPHSKFRPTSYKKR